MSFEQLTIFKLFLNKIKIQNLDSSYWIQEIYNIQKQDTENNKSNKVSNIGGYQSDADILQNPIFYPLVQILNNYIIDSFSNPNLRIKGMWCNISSQHHCNWHHSHSTNITEDNISGVLYLQTPLNCGNITFGHPYCFNLDIYSHIPSRNELLMFDSRLVHRVEPNKSNEDRISISFNT